MKKRTAAFVAVVALQAGFLLAWAGWHEYASRTAPVITLRTEPVDPRDILRGDYMILSYPIGRIDEAEPNIRGGAVWAILEPRGEFHELLAVSLERPTADQVPPGGYAVRADSNGGHQLRYGIEHFYVPEGKGTPIFEDLRVQAIVAPHGRLRLKTVLVDGQPYP
jgi:uncharacterized membrane-anchored protein